MLRRPRRTRAAPHRPRQALARSTTDSRCPSARLLRSAVRAAVARGAPAAVTVLGTPGVSTTPPGASTRSSDLERSALSAGGSALAGSGCSSHDHRDRKLPDARREIGQKAKRRPVRTVDVVDDQRQRPTRHPGGPVPRQCSGKPEEAVDYRVARPGSPGPASGEPASSSPAGRAGPSSRFVRVAWRQPRTTSPRTAESPPRTGTRARARVPTQPGRAFRRPARPRPSPSSAGSCRLPAPPRHTRRPPRPRRPRPAVAGFGRERRAFWSRRRVQVASVQSLEVLDQRSLPHTARILGGTPWRKRDMPIRPDGHRAHHSVFHAARALVQHGRLASQGV